ncbi:MAG: hypothetical protein U0929_16490 [Planctomycetaceae bacterium]
MTQKKASDSQRLFHLQRINTFMKNQTSKQSVMSDHGTFAGDQIVNLPDDVAQHWIDTGLAVSAVETPKLEPKVKPKKEDIKIEVIDEKNS